MMDDMLIRENVRELLEPFIYKKLECNKYKINNQSASELLTWNRLDLAFKLFYLDNIDVCSELAKEVYSDDIKAQTLGTFIERGNEESKRNFENYIEHFSATYASIKKNGFSKERTLVPLSLDGAILNGAHRVASAIHLNKMVSTIVTEQTAMVADYKYFIDRDVCIRHIDIVVQKFIQYSENNIYLAFLWPSGVGHEEEVENMFSQVLYKKKIRLTSRGALNLLTELYKHMSWAGTCENGYSGVRQKLVECFPRVGGFQVIFFQAEDIGQVRKLKEKVRGVYGIGYSSIHITDTKEEAARISQLLCNENGLHFLNYAEPYEFINIYKKLRSFKQFLFENEIDCNDVVVDGSSTLALYGLRESVDIDFLALNNVNVTFQNNDFEKHDSELKHHGKGKEALIYDDRNSFVFYGLKFIAFSQLYQMKLKRDEEKDRNDCLMMKASLEGKSYSKMIAQFKQRTFYTKIKLNSVFARKIRRALELVGLYSFARTAFRKLKGLK